jgi:hypothetical protein
MSYQNIIERLEASKEKCARLESECVLLEDAIQEYTRAWDAAGVIWNEACKAEENGMFGKAKKLWSLLAPFDDEAATRLEALL